MSNSVGTTLSVAQAEAQIVANIVDDLVAADGYIEVTSVQPEASVDIATAEEPVVAPKPPKKKGAYSRKTAAKVQAVAEAIAAHKPESVGKGLDALAKLEVPVAPEEEEILSILGELAEDPRMELVNQIAKIEEQIAEVDGIVKEREHIQSMFEDTRRLQQKVRSELEEARKVLIKNKPTLARKAFEGLLEDYAVRICRTKPGWVTAKEELERRQGILDKSASAAIRKQDLDHQITVLINSAKAKEAQNA